MTNETDWTEIRRRIESAGFAHYGFARLERPLSMDFYESWLAKEYAGDMGYLARHAPDKRDPGRLLPRAKSAIVITQSYFPHPAPSLHWPLRAARVALYARGEDYHSWFKRSLADLGQKLKELAPHEEFLAFTDSAPVLERDLAYRAGLGWVGKNTCLIHHKRGSLFFIGEIYTTLPLNEAEALVPDFCGTCTRCLDACPTGALVSPRELDARKCISYVTIEAKDPAPENLRAGVGEWLFGCDICQTVCPWNLKVHGKQTFLSQDSTKNDDARSADLVADLRMLLSSSNRELLRLFKGTPLMRAGAVGLKRNALVVCGNLRLRELEPEVRTLVDHPRLGEPAAWCLKQLKSAFPPG